MLGVELLGDPVDAGDVGQGIAQHDNGFLRGAHVHDLQEGVARGQRAEGHRGGLANDPGVVGGQGGVVGVRADGGRLGVLLGSPQPLQEQLQPPQGPVQAQHGPAARVGMLRPPLDVHQPAGQLIGHHGLQRAVLLPPLSAAVALHDLYFSHGVLGDEGEDGAQAVEEPAGGGKRKQPQGRQRAAPPSPSPPPNSPDEPPPASQVGSEQHLPALRHGRLEGAQHLPQAEGARGRRHFLARAPPPWAGLRRACAEPLRRRAPALPGRPLLKEG